MAVPPRPSAPPPPAVGGAVAVAPAPGTGGRVVPPAPDAPGTAPAVAVLPRAGVGLRLAGYAIDLVLVAATGAIGVLLGGWALGVVLALEAVVVTVALEARRGVTLGKLLTRTRATTAGENLAPGLRREAVRASLFGASHLAAGLGQIAVLAAAGRARAWHDRVAGTDVVTLRAPTARRAAAPGAVAAVPPRPQVPAVPVTPGTVGATAPAGGYPAPGTAAGAWRPPELLDVPVSADSISMREFRALRDAAAGRPPGAAGTSIVPPRPADRPSTTVPPRPAPVVPATRQPSVPEQRIAPQPAPTPSRAPAGDFRPPPGSSAATGTPAAGRATRVVLTTRDGASHTIVGSAVVGRRPRAESEDVQIIEIADVARSLSRTHIRVRLIDGVAWVEDAGSANGTRLRLPDATLVPLGPGAPVRLVDGAVLELGQVSLDVALG